MIPISVFGGSDAVTIDEVVARTRVARAAGIPKILFPQVMAIDALTALAVAAREVPDIGLGTAVVPIQGRHPIPMAVQALTVADAAGPGRFTLGIGVTHAPVSEGIYGIPYGEVVDRCREHLEALSGLLSTDRKTDVVGAFLTARLSLPAGVPPPTLLLAALGPKMLALAGRYTDGTVTWMTGPATVATHIVPTLAEAASAAGRPDPETVVGLPVCVTARRDEARGRVGAVMAGAATMRSYQRMLAMEGVAEPVDIALVGDADEVGSRIEELGAAGASELLANVQGDDEEREATMAFLGTLG